MHRQQHAQNRADRVGAIDPANAAFACAPLQQGISKQRQGHPGQNRGGQHDEHGDGLAGEMKQGVAAVIFGEAADHEAHEVEAAVVQGQGAYRAQAHQHLHITGIAQRGADLIQAAANPQAAQGQTQNEGAEHQFKRLG